MRADMKYIISIQSCLPLVSAFVSLVCRECQTRMANSQVKFRTSIISPQDPFVRANFPALVRHTDDIQGVPKVEATFKRDDLNSFKFINSFRPDDSKSKIHRKAVRSQAARPHYSKANAAAIEESKIRRKGARSRRNVKFQIHLNVGAKAWEGTDAQEDTPFDGEDVNGHKSQAFLNLDGGWVAPFTSVSSPERSKAWAPGIINHCKSADNLPFIPDVCVYRKLSFIKPDSV